MSPASAVVLADLPLRGRGGEPVDLRRTLCSHGVASLLPNRVDQDRGILETTVLSCGGQARSLRLASGDPGTVRVLLLDGPASEVDRRDLLAVARRILGLDVDLSGFYARAARDPPLAWITSGAGRMMHSPAVFDDVVKTICTTNCSWSATERMVGALVQCLGETAPGGGRAFPTAAALAAAPDDFLRGVARCGYRASYLQGLATEVAAGRLRLEELRRPELSDAEVERTLLDLPGVGPYAAAHIMLTSLGRYRPLILDSWTRPAYAKLTGRRTSDAALRRRFAKYGDFAGLAFWLTVTRDWVDA